MILLKMTNYVQYWIKAIQLFGLDLKHQIKMNDCFWVCKIFKKSCKNDFLIKKWPKMTTVWQYLALFDIIWLFKRYSFCIWNKSAALIRPDSGTEYQNDVNPIISLCLQFRGKLLIKDPICNKTLNTSKSINSLKNYFCAFISLN